MPLSGHDLVRIGGETFYSDASCASVHLPDDDLGTQWSADCRMMMARIGRKALERDARADAGPVGVTASSFNAVSLTPPLIL